MSSYMMLTDLLVHMKVDLSPSNGVLVHVLDLMESLRPGGHSTNNKSNMPSCQNHQVHF